MLTLMALIRKNILLKYDESCFTLVFFLMGNESACGILSSVWQDNFMQLNVMSHCSVLNYFHAINILFNENMFIL